MGLIVHLLVNPRIQPTLKSSKMASQYRIESFY